jgi:hypothetical protein
MLDKFFNKPSAKRIISFSFIIVFLFLIGVTVNNIYLFRVKDRLNAELESKNSKLDELEMENSFFSKKSNADDLFISYRFEESLNFYEEIINEYELKKDLVENRKSIYKEFLLKEKKRDSVLNSLKNLLAKYQNNIEDNNSKITELLNFQKNQENKYKDEIAKLKLSNKNYQADVLNLKNEIKNLNDKGLLRFKNSKDKEITYLGGVKDDKANGVGIGIMPSGAIYEGGWKDNMKHGNGIYKWEDGEKYEGEFKEDKRNGHGIYIWKNGDKYIGQWKNDRRHGKGILYDKNSKVLFDGNWENDEFKKESK